MEVDCHDRDIFTNLLTGNAADSHENSIVPNIICSIDGAYHTYFVNSCLHVLFVKDKIVRVSVCSFTRNVNTGALVVEKQDTYHITQRPIDYLPKVFYISGGDANISVDKALYANLFKTTSAKQLLLFSSSSGGIYYKTLKTAEATLLCDVRQNVKQCFFLTLTECGYDLGDNFPPIDTSKVVRVSEEIKGNLTDNNCLCFISETGKCVSAFHQAIISPTRIVFYENQLISPVQCCAVERDVLVISNGSEIFAYQAFLQVKLLMKTNEVNHLKDNLRILLEFKLLYRISVADIQTLYIMKLNPFELVAYRQGKLMLLVCEEQSSPVHTTNFTDFITSVEQMNERINNTKAESNNLLNKLFQLSMASSTVQRIKTSQRDENKILPLDVHITPCIVNDASRKNLLLICKMINNTESMLPDGCSIHITYYKKFSKEQCKQTGGTFICKSETISIPTIKSKRHFEFCASIHEDFIGFSPIVMDFYLYYFYGTLQESVKEFGSSCYLKNCLLDIPELCLTNETKTLEIKEPLSRSEGFYHASRASTFKDAKMNHEFSVMLARDVIVNNLPQANIQQASVKSNVLHFLFGKDAGDLVALTLSHLNGEKTTVSFKETDCENLILLVLVSNNLLFLAWVHIFILGKLNVSYC